MTANLFVRSRVREGWTIVPGDAQALVERLVRAAEGVTMKPEPKPEPAPKWTEESAKAFLVARLTESRDIAQATIDKFAAKLTEGPLYALAHHLNTGLFEAAAMLDASNKALSALAGKATLKTFAEYTQREMARFAERPIRAPSLTSKLATECEMGAVAKLWHYASVALAKME